VIVRQSLWDQVASGVRHLLTQGIRESYGRDHQLLGRQETFSLPSMQNPVNGKLC
jgi:hypothetical protein